MRHEQTIANRIIEVVSRSPGCLLEDLTLACPSLTWKQVFIEIDRLRRNGTLLLERKDPGIYLIHLPGKRLKRSDCESMV
jgi:hypothetical protein